MTFDRAASPTSVFSWLRRFCLWNWKATILSTAVRAPIFLGVTLTHGWRRASLAALIEAAYRVLTSGYLGGLTQVLSRTEPLWRSAICVTVVLPGTELWADYLIHHASGTPNLRAGMIAAFAMTVLSSLFNFYSMRNGTLIVGTGAKTLAGDLRALPQLILRFVTGPVVWFWRSAWSALQAPAGN